MSDSTTQSVLFPGIFAKPVVVKLDHEHSSSDGGALLLKAIDERLDAHFGHREHLFRSS